MLKKLFIALAIFFSVFVLFYATVRADEKASDATTSGHVKYDLAYPGMLPDNPLYKIKLIRDKITNFLISDPRRKVDFYLLQADKGILAAAILIDKSKVTLAENTALKAEHNMTLINIQIPALREKPDDSFFKKLMTASKKHQEVLSSLIKRLPNEKQHIFISVLNFSKSNLATLERFNDKNPKMWNNWNNWNNSN